MRDSKIERVRSRSLRINSFVLLLLAGLRRIDLFWASNLTKLEFIVRVEVITIVPLSDESRGGPEVGLSDRHGIQMLRF